MKVRENENLVEGCRKKLIENIWDGDFMHVRVNTNLKNELHAKNMFENSKLKSSIHDTRENFFSFKASNFIQ